MNLCIFEDFFISELYPVNYLRHTSGLICGAVTVKEKIEHYFKPRKLFIYTRNYLSPYLREKYRNCSVNIFPEKECLFVNSRVIFTKELAVKISSVKKSTIWLKGGTIIAVYAKGIVLDLVNKIFSTKPAEPGDFGGLELEKKELKKDVKIIGNVSDLITYHKEELESDLKNIHSGKKLHVSPKCKISRRTEFDTSTGRIYIGKNTEIEPFCYIKGPAYIGNNCLVRSGSRIYGPVTTGDYCKISGEITNTIMHSFVNKQHLGFLGHSYLGEWVNLGAGTNTSNLKNNYSEIVLKSPNKTVNTGSIFLGSIIGDHTKTGINTMLNTGTLTGISCNIFGNGYHDKFIKSFSWLDASTGKYTEYEFNKAVHTARVSMLRRHVEMSGEYEDLMKYIFINKDKLGV